MKKFVFVVAPKVFRDEEYIEPKMILEQAGIECPDAIITATSLGCLENSERLLVQLYEEGEVMLKPTYFM